MKRGTVVHLVLAAVAAFGFAGRPAVAQYVSLTATSTETLSVTLEWTAPGFPDPFSGELLAANSYELRYSASPPSSPGWWDNALTVGVPGPATPGTVQSTQVTGLTQNTFYWFQLAADCPIPDYPDLYSGHLQMRTLADPYAPAAIVDLGAEALKAGWVKLTWTATGDDGTIGLLTGYDLRYSVVGPLSTPEGFNQATPAGISPVPAAPGDVQTVSVGVADGITCWFAIRARDEVGNWSIVSNSPSVAVPAYVKDDEQPGPCALAPSGFPAAAILSLVALLLLPSAARKS